jgi:hypothetical protein
VLTLSKSGETDNNILSYLYNPLNTHLTAGGSSVGEGAIGALKGSAFGLGTDSGMHSRGCTKEILKRFRWIGLYAGSIQRNLQLGTMQRQIAVGRHPNKLKCVALHLISISNVA